jgi:hypothetical protein
MAETPKINNFDQNEDDDSDESDTIFQRAADVEDEKKEVENIRDSEGMRTVSSPHHVMKRDMN